MLSAQTAFSHVVDGRFKGGYITRHYGRPGAGVHAVQLEMCWRTYMRETPPYDWRRRRVPQRVQPVLRELVQAMIGWRPAR